MNVFVLVEDDYESNYVRGVFSTLEAAGKEARRLTLHRLSPGGSPRVGYALALMQARLQRREDHRGPTRLEDARFVGDYEPELEAWGYVVGGTAYLSIYRFEVDSVP